MTTLELAEIIEIMKNKWPKWNGTKSQVDGFSKIFLPYSFYDVKQVIEKAEFETNFSTPPNKTIKKLLSNYTKRLSKDYEPYQEFFIMCTDESDGCKCQIGTHSKIYVKPGMSLEKARSDAIQRHTNQYGGKWAVFEGCTDEDMFENMMQARNIPKPEPGVCFKDAIKKMVKNISSLHPAPEAFVKNDNSQAMALIEEERREYGNS